MTMTTYVCFMDDNHVPPYVTKHYKMNEWKSKGANEGDHSMPVFIVHWKILSMAKCKTAVTPVC